MSISVDRREGHRCTACDARQGPGREYEPRAAVWTLSASDDTLGDPGAQVRLCERHAMAAFNALGLMLYAEGLLKIGKGTGGTAKYNKLVGGK